jgi:hypothetical protein
MRKPVSLAALLACLTTTGPGVLAQTVVGHVIADVTDAPIVAASVELLDSYRNFHQRVFTDSTGRFVIEPGEPGTYHLRVHSIGYRSNTTPSFGVEFDDALRVRVVLSPEVVLLAPLEIHARSRPLLRRMTMQGWEERRALGIGVAITRDRIEQRPGASVTDLLRLVPSVRVISSGGSTDVTIQGAGQAIFGGTCRVQIYLDGRKFESDATTFDHLFAWDIEAIEVFRNLSELPAEMAGPESRCGVIAVWTRRR